MMASAACVARRSTARRCQPGSPRCHTHVHRNASTRPGIEEMLELALLVGDAEMACGNVDLSVPQLIQFMI